MLRRDFLKWTGLTATGNQVVGRTNNDLILTTGFPFLDQAIGGGMKKGDTHVIAGLPGTGKSKFANKIYKANQLRKVVVFRDMQNFDIIHRTVNNHRLDLIVIDDITNIPIGKSEEPGSWAKAIYLEIYRLHILLNELKVATVLVCQSRENFGRYATSTEPIESPLSLACLATTRFVMTKPGQLYISKNRYGTVRGPSVKFGV